MHDIFAVLVVKLLSTFYRQSILISFFFIRKLVKIIDVLVHRTVSEHGHTMDENAGNPRGDDVIPSQKRRGSRRKLRSRNADNIPEEGKTTKDIS